MNTETAERLTEESIAAALDLSNSDWNLLPDVVRQMLADLFATSTPTPRPAPRPAPDHGRENALAWFALIVEMVDQVRAGEASPAGPDNRGEDAVDARERITESALSVEVRSPWYAPGEGVRRMGTDSVYPLAPAEYCILLSTGGPALRLMGDLSEHGEPESARLEAQDWGTPRTEIRIGDLAERLTGNRYDKLGIDDMVKAGDAVREYLLDFARQFYFGE